MRRLRKRYGRATSDSSYTIEQSGNLFLVKLTRDIVHNGKTIPAGTTLGVINERGTTKVWRSAGYNPRGYGEVARSLLDAAKHDLKSSGRIMAKQRAKEHAEERASGSVIVKIGSDPSTYRFHDFARARAFAEESLLKLPVGTRAEFFRAQIGDTPRTGMPWTIPYHVEETYEWNGQKRVGMAKG